MTPDEIYFYSRIFIVFTIGFVGVICASILIFRGKFKESIAFLPFLIICGWLVSGGKIKITLNSIEAEAAAFSALAQNLPKEPTQSANVAVLTKDYDQGVVVWWKLLQYRIESRALLREICIKASCKLEENDTSFSDLLEQLQNKNTLEPELASQLEKIREYTYYFEWRSGRIPDEEAIKYVLTTAPKAIEKLHSIRQEQVHDFSKNN